MLLRTSRVVLLSLFLTTTSAASDLETACGSELASLVHAMSTTGVNRAVECAVTCVATPDCDSYILLSSADPGVNFQCLSLKGVATVLAAGFTLQAQCSLEVVVSTLSELNLFNLLPLLQHLGRLTVK